MKESFRILKNSNRNMPQISLMGDFDVPAANQLLKSIEDSCCAVNVVVRTDCLTSIAAGASEHLFQAFLRSNELRSKVYFCGAFARDIAPRGTLVY